VVEKAAQVKRVTLDNKAIVRQQALRQLCLGGDGKLTKNAAAVLVQLRRFCNGDGVNSFPLSQETGTIDPYAMVRMAGRREVFDLLVKMLAVTLEARHNLDELT
jgi:hypothetical protein